MQAIASEFNATLINLERKRSNGTEHSILEIKILRTSSKASNSLLDLTSYFSRFPLFTGKHLDYQEWSKVLALTIKGTHQTKDAPSGDDQVASAS
jgi:hypothetical protein